MSRWFRMYDEALDDPKVQRLSGDDFKGWVNLLCLASRNGGKLPSLTDVSFALRRSSDDALTLLERLRDGGLIDSCSGGANGSHDVPHGWAKRQYKSDGSTERVKRFRERSKPVTVTPPETDTEADTEVTKDKPLLQRAKRTAMAKPDDVEDQVWDDFGRLRAKQKALPTETAIAGIRREAGKLGWSLNQALAECCERNWRGFKAEWTQQEQRNGRQSEKSVSGYGRTVDAALDFVREANAMRGNG